MKKNRVMLSWSSGKDAAWALHVLRQDDQYEVVALLTTTNQEFDRVAMHGVRRELLEAQAAAAGLPLIVVPLPWPCTNIEYESIMDLALQAARSQFDFTHCAFGDLFLEDVRQYREEKLAGTGLTPIFPLWGIPTDELARQMIEGGLEARITCLNPKNLPMASAGRSFDSDFLHALTENVDPCGERGEFHTFAYAGPMFAHPIEVRVGDVVERDGFVFADLLPGTSPESTT